MLKHDKLFEQLPELKDHRIDFVSADEMRKKGVDQSVYGWYSADDKVIALAPSLLSKGPEEVKKTLLHELQHVVQKGEGWDEGANSEDIRRRIRQVASTLPLNQADYVSVRRGLQKHLDDIEELKAFEAKYGQRTDPYGRDAQSRAWALATARKKAEDELYRDWETLT